MSGPVRHLRIVEDDLAAPAYRNRSAGKAFLLHLIDVKWMTASASA